ncbi:hypothetical protein [Microbispora hainanensis]|uniref:Uncharacterized protein n=1 Tax=Microbispora hainanensis TaxID=568844 RepID=A0ABZ1SUV6_9ACTN|nr:hypothetical protein [Microbispora hainanensis]
MSITVPDTCSAIRRILPAPAVGTGYAVGNRPADTYLAATGQTAAQALHADSSDVIAATLRPGG